MLTSEDFKLIKTVNRDSNLIYLEYCGNILSVNRKFDLESRVVELLTQLCSIKNIDNCCVIANNIFRKLSYSDFCLLLRSVR